jgi:hypothetical protein
MSSKRDKMITDAEKRLGRKIPKRYVPTTLSIPDLKKQLQSIVDGTKRPDLQSAKPRRSTFTIKAERYFGKGNTNKDAMASRLSRGNTTRKNRLKEAFDTIYDRGMEAYRTSGSRPNVSPQAWGQARIYSVLFGGKARNQDADIVKKYRLPQL